MSHVFIIKLYPLCCLVSLGSGLLECGACCSDTKHTSSVCDDIAVSIKFGAGMIAVIILFAVKLLKASYLKALLILDRISV